MDKNEAELLDENTRLRAELEQAKAALAAADDAFHDGYFAAVAMFDIDAIEDFESGNAEVECDIAWRARALRAARDAKGDK